MGVRGMFHFFCNFDWEVGGEKTLGDYYKQTQNCVSA
jgi:hypothetical protein